MIRPCLSGSLLSPTISLPNLAGSAITVPNTPAYHIHQYSATRGLLMLCELPLLEALLGLSPSPEPCKL